MAKDKLERGFRIFWDNSASAAQDISCGLLPGTITGGGQVLDEVDMTGVCDAIYKFLGGNARSPVSGQFHMDDTAVTGAFTVLEGTEGEIGTLTLEYGSNGAAPTTGDPVWEGEYVLLGFTAAQNAGKMVLNPTWQPAAGAADPAWATKT